MNKKSWMVLRIVAGLYLVFLGVQIISQVTKEQPNNLALMICAAVLFIGVGVVYAGAAISSVWKMSRGGEKSQEDDLQIVEKEDSMETSMLHAAPSWYSIATQGAANNPRPIMTPSKKGIPCCNSLRDSTVVTSPL